MVPAQLFSYLLDDDLGSVYARRQIAYRFTINQDPKQYLVVYFEKGMFTVTECSDVDHKFSAAEDISPTEVSEAFYELAFQTLNALTNLQAIKGEFGELTLTRDT